MKEFEQNIDYSMPRQNGLYPPPPIIYKNARALLLFFQCSPDIKEKYIPPELVPIKGGIDALIILEYPETSIGPYNECIVELNCKFKNIPGAYIFSIYVDDDVALTAGREIWGIPKKMADIALSQIQNNIIKATVTRKGTVLFDVEVKINKNPPGLDPKDMFNNLPFYNLKLIPDVADNSKFALRQLTETYIKIGNVHKSYSGSPKFIKSNLSKYDISHKILKDAQKDLGGIYVEYDFILPNGRVLE